MADMSQEQQVLSMIKQLGVDPDKLVCTFCGKTPVVGFTFIIDANAEKDGAELDEKSLIAVCRDHLPILQEKIEQIEKDFGPGDEVSSDE